MIDVVITSFNEPKTIGRAIESFLSQSIDEPCNIVVCAPDEPTLEVARMYAKKYSKVKTFKDPGKGKSFALNTLLPRLKGRIIVLSDGDVYVKKGSLKDIISPFKDENVGCVTGRPVSMDSKKNIFGYWSHLLCDAGAHEARRRRAEKGEFLECSGYYWAFRNGVIKKFPTDIAEDTVVPLLFREKGYKVAYVPSAEVYVSFPKNLKDFIEQKKRTAKSHESLSKYVNVKKIPRTKSFRNEILEGHSALFYPRTITEVLYTFALFPIRLYIWAIVFYQTKVSKKHYSDAWKRVESTK